MKPKGFLLVCALLAWGLSACGQTQSQANAGQDNAPSQFLADRGGSPAPESARLMDEGSTIMGVIEKVDGSSIQLNRPMLGQTVTIKLAPDAKILMQADAQPSELQTGDQVMLMGEQQGDVYQAHTVQIGTAGTLGGGPVAIPAPGSTQGQMDQAAITGDSVMSGALAGTVVAVDGATFTLKSGDGKTIAVQLMDNAQLRKQKQFGPEALETGRFVIARGAQKDDTFEATEIEVLPPPGAS